jgi:dTDP-4-amino-4,6-dideoxygalactose transaminase
MNVPFVDMGRLHSDLRNELLAAFARVLDSGAYVMGGETSALEREFAASYGVKHALAVSNGTTALHLALVAAGVKPGDEVITVANTFIATAEAISMAGATPVFVDIDPDTMLIDPDAFAAAITWRTRAVIPVHLYGRMAAMDRITAIARSRGVKVIEDACQAHGAIFNGRRAGAIGDAGCLSFYPTKNLGTVGEGGMVLTNDDAIAARITSLRNHGQAERHHHVEPGYNYRMPELQAAALRVQLPHLEAWNAARIRAAAWYAEALEGVAVDMPHPGLTGSHVYHLFVIRHPDRVRLQQALTERGIGTAIHYPVPIHLQPAYRCFASGAGSLPHTEAAVSEILSLPMHPSITRDEVAVVASAVRSLAGSHAMAAAAAGGAS